MKKEITGLDFIRFFCAFSVMCSHLLPDISDNYSWAKYGGSISVYIFFVISGFIIPYSAEGRSPSSFFTGRIVRLVPGVWICATLSIFAMYLSVSDAERATLFGKYVRSCLLVPFVPWHINNLDELWVSGTFWTLFVEISFYALVLVLLLAKAFDKIGKLATILGVNTLIFWSTWLVFQGTIEPGQFGKYILKNDYNRILDLALVTHGAFFGLGINIWLLTIKKSPKRMVSTFICAAAGVLDATHGAIADNSSEIIALSALIFGVSLVIASTKLQFSKVLIPKSGSRLIGLTSYPLYLIHIPLGHSMILGLAGLGLAKSSATWLSMTAVIFVAAAISRFAEPTLQKAFKSWLEHFKPLSPN